MKRSEMVKIIEDAIKCWNGAFFDESLESYIVYRIEESGMLPPPDHFEPIVVDKANGFVAEISYDNPLTDYNLTFWEPEDEKK